MFRRCMALATLALVLTAPGALAAGKGTSMLALGVSNGAADLYSADGGGYISAFDHSEIGLKGEYWLMMTDDYAFTLAGGIGFFSEKNEPGTGSAPGDPERTYSQSSFSVRLGGDRVAKVGDRAILYFGPGLEFWSGKAKFENFGFVAPPAADEYETENVTRISVSTRIGAHMLLGSNWGLTCHLDRLWGHASAEENGAKATWWPSSTGASGGLMFMFGGE